MSENQKSNPKASSQSKTKKSKKEKKKEKKQDTKHHHHQKIGNVNDMHQALQVALTPKVRVYERRNGRQILSPSFVDNFVRPCLDKVLPENRSMALHQRFDLVKSEEQHRVLSKGKDMLFQMMGFKRDSDGFWKSEPMWFVSAISFKNQSTSSCVIISDEVPLCWTGLATDALIGKLFQEYQLIQANFFLRGQLNLTKPISTNYENIPLLAGIDPVDSTALTTTVQALQLAEGKCFYIQQNTDPSEHKWHARAVGQPDLAWVPCSTDSQIAYWKMVSTVQASSFFVVQNAIYTKWYWMEVRFRGQVIE